MVKEMLDAALNGAYGAEGGVAGEAMSKGLPVHAVLLVGVSKGDVGPLLHVIPRTRTGGDALVGRMAECCVGETERLATATISGG